MPYLTKKQFEDLQRAGNKMANLCYNLSQHKGQPFSDVMNESQAEWDACIENIRQRFIDNDRKWKAEALSE